MKKIASMALICVCTLSLVACGNKSDSKSSSSPKVHSTKVTKKKTSKKKSSIANSSSNSTSSSSSTVSSSANVSSSNEALSGPGIPTELIGTYQEPQSSIENTALGFPATYTFTATEMSISYSNMPIENIEDCSWKRQGDIYIISGTGQARGIYKGGAETNTIQVNGNLIKMGDSDYWASKQ